MRIYEFNQTAEHVYDTKEIIEVLLRDCQPYLNEIDGNVQKYVLYRGMETVPASGFGRKDARLSDRRARNTRSDMQAEINEFFTTHFEHPFRNGVYATGNANNASYFTKDDMSERPYAIFPIGNFDYLWNPNLDDMYNLLISIAPTSVAGTMEKLLPTYKTNDLKKAITSEVEVMLWTQEYYYLEEQKLYEIGKYLL